MDVNKKISFGFNKLVKKPAVRPQQPLDEKKVELVECLEGQAIKIKDAVEVVNEPLVIPIKDNKKNLLDRVKEARSKQSKLIKPEIKEYDRPDSELTIEELAARELLRDAKNRLENNGVSASRVTVLPVKEDTLTIEGEQEPTLEDYENVPISDYGLAMLRGMGWKEGMGVGKNTSNVAVVSAPELRPKGLGLGATKIVKPSEPVCDKEGKELILKKGAYAKIIAGAQKGNYCEVQGLDDEAGRVIVKTSLKGDILTLNEFLIVPVTNEEYFQGAKVLNNAKYEEYKKKSDRNLEKQRKERNNENEHNSDSEPEYESKYDRKQKDKSKKKEHSNRRNSSDHEIQLSSDSERKSRGKKSDKSRNENEYERDKYNDKHERHRSKYKDKETCSSDSDDKNEKSKNKHQERSDSDSRSRKKRGKEKTKDKHRDRSRSRKEREKNESKKSGRRSRDRSPHNYKRKDKKHKSKSRHSRRSNSSSSPEKESRSNRR